MTARTRWSPLPRGVFTGLDWARPGVTAGADPTLIWAEADRFAACGGVPRWLPMAVELAAGVTVADFVAAGSAAWLTVPPAYLGPDAAGLRFCTARVGPAFFGAAGRRARALVSRMELGLPVGERDDAGRQPPEVPVRAPDTPAAPGTRRLRGPVVGLIDDSVALAHANFLHAGAPRIAHFWRQDGAGHGRVPAGFGYGHELDAADIEAAMQANTYAGLVDEDAVYRALGLSVLGQPWPGGRSAFHALDLSVSHGTHVLDLAAGGRRPDATADPDAPPDWAAADDAASRAPIVAVQLDYDTVRDTSGGSLGVHVLDGLLYILSRCEAQAQVVVNISFGTLAGPHDGSSVLEAAMDQLIALRGGRLQIVLAAGNSYQARGHVNALLRNHEQMSIDWRGQPDDSSWNFLEIWLSEGAEGVRIGVTPPGRDALPALACGTSGLWTDGGDQPLCVLVFPAHVATGRRGTCALLAVAPTTRLASDAATAPSGVWQVHLENRGTAPVIFDAYIERDDVMPGTHRRARPSHFEDARYDTSGDPGAFVDDPENPTPIRRSGSFNAVATGRHTVSAGGERLVTQRPDERWATYSPRAPDPDAARPERPGVVKVPVASAASDENAALTGWRAAGTRSGSVVRLRGTSDAAPQIARQRLDSA